MALDEVGIKLSATDLDKLVMVNDKVLIEVFDTRNKVGEIYVPITSENPFIPDRGIVVKVSDNVCFSLGDCVIIEKYKGKRVYVGDRQFILLDKSYVIAKIEN